MLTDMESLGSVQKKISCVFETGVLDEPSTKRDNQSYKVVAKETIKQRALDNDVMNAIATEKLDGTCVYIAQFEGKPWLWARFDKKPNKGAERRFKKFQYQQKERKSCEESKETLKFHWDLVKDFKDTPQYWIPASHVEIVAGSPVPDDIGHTPGWVPISPGARQYCWHLSAVDLNNNLALVLSESDTGDELILSCVHLSDLEGHTAELIGTNINGNPYGLGSKKFPIHLLVIHGTIKVRNPPDINISSVKDWFKNTGHVEGIVWHCTNRTLFKVHRNHVTLSWPVDNPSLSRLPVRISTNISCDLDTDTLLINQLIRLNGHVCDSLTQLEQLLCAEGTITDICANGQSSVS
ncbi:hypothetical protein ACF0H5_016445 [Mactra antiquata]